MKKRVKSSIRWSRLLFLCLLPAGVALAQTYPAKPVHVIVPYPAGGSTDVLARMMSTKMAEALGQPFLVESKVGAAGQIASDFVAKSPPDGHTVLLTPLNLAIMAAMYRKLPFDPARDFAPVTQLTATELVMVANSKFEARTIKELIALAKAKPGAVQYGSNGVGDIFHLTMEMFNSAAGVKTVNIPYKGDTQLTNAIIGGEVPIAVTTLASVTGHIQAGRVRMLAATGTKRSALFPTIPTVAESGLPGFESAGWQGFFVAANTPRQIVRRIQGEAVKALNTPDVLGRMGGLGWAAVGSTSEEFEAMFRREIAKFKRIVQEANIPQVD